MANVKITQTEEAMKVEITIPYAKPGKKDVRAVSQVLASMATALDDQVNHAD